MKTIARQLATGTFLIVLLLIGTIQAEASKRKALNNETIETALQLENWMTDETVWNSSDVNNADVVLETEAGLQLEDWMTDSEDWNADNGLVEETELELESWMTNDSSWNVNSIENEPEITIENWMISRSFWK